MTNASNCSARSDNLNYTITDIYSFSNDESPLLIYPNPVKGILNVEHKGNATIRLTSLQGTTMAIYQSKDKAIIDLSSFSKGVYIIEVMSGNTKHRKMVILQ